ARITMICDAINQLINLLDPVATTVFGYTAVGQLACDDGPWHQDNVSFTYSSRHLAALSLLQPDASPWQQSYSYDANPWLLTQVSSPAGSFTYGYNPSYWGATLFSLTLPSGASIPYTYGATSRLLTATALNSAIYGGAI